MKKVFLSCLCFISIVSYGIELRQTDQSGIDLIFGYEYGKPDENIFYSPKHALTFVPYTSKSEDGKRYFSIWMFRNDKIRFENIIGQISMRSVDDAEMEEGSSKRRIRLAFGQNVVEVAHLARPARGDDGDIDGFRGGARQF